MTPPRLGVDARHAARGLGISTFVTQISAAMASSGRVEVVWLGSVDAAPPGLESHPVAGPYPRLDVLDARRVSRAHRLDAFLFAGNSGPPRPIGIPTVLTVHDLLFFGHARPRALRQLVGHAYERWDVPRAIRSATRVATVSETSARDIRRLAPGRDVAVIPHGMTSRAAAGTAVRDAAVVAFAGRDPRKRTQLVLDAYELLAEPRPPLVLFASAGLPDGAQERLDAYPASHDVTVVTGHASRADVDATIAAGVALVYPAEREGFGLPVLEGMASGVPVVTGLAPSTREIAGDAALLIDPADPARSIADAIASVPAGSSAREDLVQRGRDHVGTFTWDRAAGAYADLVDDALAASA